jgi:hypothetical protein
LKFWEDIWLRTAPLAIQFWDLYYICNQKTKTLAEVWVDRELRLSFRRTFSLNMVQMWEDLSDVVDHAELNGD